MKHRETHPTPVEGCFGCHLLAVNIGSAPSETTSMERRWDKDMPAYKRLRRNGLQPKHIDGCAELETRASDQFEVEMGHIVPKEERSRVRSGLEIAKELQGA